MFKNMGVKKYKYKPDLRQFTWYFGVLSIKTRLESEPVTAYLTTTVVHNYELLINDLKPVHSLDRLAH